MVGKERDYSCGLPFSLRLYTCGKLEAEKGCLSADDGKICPHLQLVGIEAVLER